jgi:protein-L-isoaspartate(D-aspartate) O-methyltransferase
LSEILLDGLSDGARLLLMVAAHQEVVPVQLLGRTPVKEDMDTIVHSLVTRGLLSRTDDDGLLALSPLGYALRDPIDRHWPDLHRSLRPQLVEQLCEAFELGPGSPLRAALHAVDRADFVPDAVRYLADLDLPVPLGVEELTSSAPHAVIAVLQAVDPRPGDRVLICGAKGGVSLALAAHCVGPAGLAHALDPLPPVVEHINRSLKHYPELQAQASFQQDVTIGWDDEKPWQIIVLNGSVPKLPWPLVHQLDENGGRLLFFLHEPKENGQACCVLRRQGSEVSVESGGTYEFPPLYGRYGWDRIEDLEMLLV